MSGPHIAFLYPTIIAWSIGMACGRQMQVLYRVHMRHHPADFGAFPFHGTRVELSQPKVVVPS